MKKKINCQDCPFYTGTQCHGHGEYWGNCTLIEQAYKVISKKAGRKHYISTGMRDICFDETQCHFITLGLFEVQKL